MRHRQWISKGAWVIPVLAVSACLQSGVDAFQSSSSKTGAQGDAAQVDTTLATDIEGSASPVIKALLERQSVLQSSGTYAQVAQAVLNSNSSPARSELRAARLRASARSKNWLPSLGPSVSITSLGDVVSALVLNQVLWDNGRKKAERAFARADVEVAAITLAEDTNTRVYEALGLYLQAAQGQETRQILNSSMKELEHFEWILGERVNAGISDPSDLIAAQQTMFELRSDLQDAQELTTIALAELRQMTDGVEITPQPTIEPLHPRNFEAIAVLRAHAEAERAVQEAAIGRADFLPTLTSSTTVQAGAEPTGGIRLGGENLLQPGAKDSRAALEQEKQAAADKLKRSREESRRTQARYEHRLKSLARQEQDAARSVVQIKENLDLFERQYKGGQRQVMDVISIYDAYIRAQQKQMTLRYEHARTRLQHARDLAILVDGDDI